MAHATAAPDLERLPWLTDEPRRRAKTGAPRAFLFWSLAALLLTAAASYWIGMSGAFERSTPAERTGARPSATIALPEAAEPPAPRAEQVTPAPAPRVEPVAAPPPVPLPRAEAVRDRPKAAPARRTKASATARPAKARAPVRKSAAKTPSPRRASPPPLWSPWYSTGASGRMVRVGTFANSRQAKIGWRKLMRAYPGMSRLPAVVVGNPSLRNGRTYYRLQIGTSSHAHSEVLCQRMRVIGQSCVVVGLNRGGRG